jgi:release factor glutamine methyltransferase
MMTTKKTRTNLLISAFHYLSKKGIISAQTEAEILLRHVCDCSRIELYLGKEIVSREKLSYYWQLITARTKGVPLQYLTGTSEFMGLEFKVHSGVFIPRPETEILTETVINLLIERLADQQTVKPMILDIGTGCGNIAISIAKYLKKVHICACDISDFALKLARENSYLHKVRICLVNSDIFSAFKRRAYFSLIVSNPPYIKRQQVALLSREIHYEPKVALDGGWDGLLYYRRIINAAPGYLQDRGLLALEIGEGQKEMIEKIIKRTRQLALIKIIKDYNGVERVLVAEKIR